MTYPPHPFGARRETVLRQLGPDAMMLPAAPVRGLGGDSEARYRPDSELFYLTGWQGDNSVLILCGGDAEHPFALFVPERDPEAERWTGPRPDLHEVRERVGVDAVFPIAEFPTRAPSLLAPAERIHYRLGASRRGDNAVRRALAEGRRLHARQGRGAMAIVDPGQILDPMRRVKDSAEIARMREAARIAAAAVREGIGAVREGAGEWQVEAAVEGGMRSRGADGPAFATIVAAGANACTLHYVANSARIGRNDLVLIDAGCAFDCYAADISRTVPAAGTLEGVRREIYQVVQEAHRAAVAQCVPGATPDDVHREACRALAEGLAAVGVLAGVADDLLEQGEYRRFFPHRTSHWLGLDIHDAGSYRDRRGAVRLEPGMVLTVEPGLYFPPGSCPEHPGLEGCGVRIEDDLLLTPSGHEVLTGDLPVAPEALFEIVGTHARPSPASA